MDYTTKLSNNTNPSFKMTREEEIKEARHEWYLRTQDADFCAGFQKGVMWADAHPRWISVEEQDIPLGQWVIAYAPNEINYCKIDVILLMMDETAEDFGITHWMPLPSIEHLKKGDKHDL